MSLLVPFVWMYLYHPALVKATIAGELTEVNDDDGQTLKTMHETAKGLHEAGTLDVMTMREFDALCLPPVKSYTPAQIKRLRTRYKASQAVFAAFLNLSPSTVQKWEQGQKKPNGPSLKLLNLVDVHGLEALSGTPWKLRLPYHLSLDKDAPEPRELEPPSKVEIIALPQVGGLHHRYTRRAA